MDTLPPHALDDNFTIYRLKDPRDNAVRYIGITVDVFERFKQHLRCDGCNPLKDAWVQELQLAQQMIIMESIERAGPLSYALEREKYWIQHYLQQGIQLFNIISVPLASLRKPKKIERRRPVPLITKHVESWDIADYPICKRNDRTVTVEQATDEEFQTWLDRNNVDPSYVDTQVLVKYRTSTDWFNRRCLIINHALDKGILLKLADGSTKGGVLWR
jgi:predicted GIY-YIG superfamily endonuclease